jgi:hypothetical protein
MSVNVGVNKNVWKKRVELLRLLLENVGQQVQHFSTKNLSTTHGDMLKNIFVDC